MFRPRSNNVSFQFLMPYVISCVFKFSKFSILFTSRLFSIDLIFSIKVCSTLFLSLCLKLAYEMDCPRNSMSKTSKNN